MRFAECKHNLNKLDNIDLNWTIKRLKQFLNDNYPKNPVNFKILIIS